MYKYAVLCLISFYSFFSFAEVEIEEVVVTAGFRDAKLMKSAGSISVVDEQTILDRAARHFDETINTLPNVSFSAGGARARFVQMRGVGDLEQFVDPKHYPSVGVTIDGIEVGTTASGALLMDVEQVEVLRGPQGTQFGANALAGLINIQTHEPTDSFEGKVYGGYGNFDSWQAGVTLSGPLADSIAGRLAIQQQKSDGFYENTFLNSETTNKRDELSLRGKLRWQGQEGAEISLLAAYADIDGGYDAFSLDNVRTTLSDNPGKDTQESAALALKTSLPVFDTVTFESTISWQKQDEEYSFDEDWVFSGFCDGIRCNPLFEFSSTDQLFRDRENYAIDLRLKSVPDRISWVAGVYAQKREESLERLRFVTFTSDYETERYAIYGQIRYEASDNLALLTGFRYEHFEDEYSDSSLMDTNTSDDYWSGQLSVEYQWDNDTLLYATLSRSVKPGGVNTETSSSFPVINPFFQPFLLSRQRFNSETLFNKELGLKGSYFDKHLRVRWSLFHMDRNNAQLESFVWDASTFIFTGFLDSNSDAENYGMELELSYDFSENLNVFSNIGYLETSVDELNVFDLDLNQFVRTTNRDQSKAPKWQYNLGLNYRLSERLSGRFEIEGRDDSFFGYYHNGKIDAYSLLNASATYEIGDISIQAWVRNLLDENYHIHGLYFANDPRDAFSVNRSYYQFGEPRVYGVNLSYSF